MHKFSVEGITVTDQSLALHGVWEFGHTKRFDVIRIPVELVTEESVLEALCSIASKKKTMRDEDWKQFLLFG